MNPRKEEIIAELKQIEARSAELESGIETADQATIEARTKEAEELATRKSSLKEELQKIEHEEMVAEQVRNNPSLATPVTTPKEKREMKIAEIVASKEYAEAYVRGIKGNNFTECREMLDKAEDRSLLTDMVNGGTVPTSKIVLDAVMHSWDNAQLVQLAPKVSVKGILSVPVETSATPAVVHTEGGDAPDEEELGIDEVIINPVSLKKWIGMSDMVYAMHGEEFLNYINAEIVQRIGELADSQLVTAIKASSLTQSVTHALDEDSITAALAVLAEEATEPVVIMRKSLFYNTYAALRGTDGHAIFQQTPENGKIVNYLNGARVIFSSAAAADEVIVGDLRGALINLPEGNAVRFTVDNNSVTARTANKIYCVGSQIAGFGVVRPDFFAVVKAGN